MLTSARLAQVAYGLFTIALSWLFMQAVHEAGHVLGAWMSGGKVVQVVLHPLTISRTDVSPNPVPLVEIWAGPIFGSAFPVSIWMLCHFYSKPLSSWFRYFAGFCLVANGAYLGYAVIEPIGDAQDLLMRGASLWSLGLFGLITIPGGLLLWHGLAPEFGIGPGAQTISWKAATTIGGLLLIVILAEIAWSAAE